LADAADLGSAAARRGGSSPFPCTFKGIRAPPVALSETRSAQFLPRRLVEDLLTAVAEGREEESWRAAQSLARGVLDHRAVTLAKAVLDAGPFALRRGVELAELLLHNAAGEPTMAERADATLPPRPHSKRQS
jgi:hypothetical protein